MLLAEGLSRQLVIVVIILSFVFAINEARIGPRGQKVVDCQGVDAEIVDYVEEIADAEIGIEREDVSHGIFVQDESQVKEPIRDEVKKTCTYGTLRRVLQQSLPIAF